MEDWQIRVMGERAELERKIQKLNMFLRSITDPLSNHLLGEGEHKRLMEQLRCMEAYHDALTDRIFNFEVHDEAD